VDLHCDTLSLITDTGQNLLSNKGHFDLLRAAEAGVSLQFMAIFSYPSEPDINLKQTLKQIDYYQQQLEQFHDYIYKIEKMADISWNQTTGKIGSLLHLEGAECIGSDLDLLHRLYELGLRSIGLTWNYPNQLAGGVGEGEMAEGLSKFGRVVVKEIQQMNMILDLAHISKKAFFEALDLYSKPVMVSHANIYNLCPHKRNLDDSQLYALADNGGIIGISQVGDFIKESKPTLNDMLDHFVYVAEKIGVEHLALGSDFDGDDNLVINDVKNYKDLEMHLSSRGFTKSEIEMILYRNACSFLPKSLV